MVVKNTSESARQHRIHHQQAMDGFTEEAVAQISAAEGWLPGSGQSQRDINLTIEETNFGPNEFANEKPQPADEAQREPRPRADKSQTR